MSDEPTRGERNNNPGNINFTPSVQYVGQLGIEIVPPGEHYAPRFARFDTPQNGLRALCVLLKVYYQRHGLHTVAGIITRWAPASDHNPTRAYTGDVAKEMGVAPDAVILLSQPDVMASMATAIVRQENDRVIYPAAMIHAAAENALGTTTPEAPRSVALPPLPEPHAAIVEQALAEPAPSLWQRFTNTLSKWRSS
jgi:hypothetical protein